MTLAIFGVGVFVFFITVYAVVVAGGLQLNAYQVRGEPELADELSIRTSADVAGSVTKSTEK